MAESFTSKQKEIVARKMGYDGPMQMFDEFLSASPSDAQKYSAITSKFAERMAKGGVVVAKAPVNEYYVGGDVAKAKAEAAANEAAYKARVDAVNKARADKAAADKAAAGKGAGAPVDPTATTYTAKTTEVTPAMKIAFDPDETPASVIADTIADKDIGTVAAPTKVTADTITADKAKDTVETSLNNLTAQTGTVSDKAQSTAVTQDPTTTAVSNVEAAQGTAAQVADVADRTLQEGELVSGSAVDMAKAEDALAKTEAAQGTVTEESTTQGQLNKLMSDFDAGAPPPWAAASLRTATNALAARGLGASSLAGQAIIQAALESAVPIATADAKVFQTMNEQNLSNRQAIAVEIGRERAKFLGQEFDQNFDTRVKNAARIADIADKNFTADVQIAIENAQLANTMNVANLSARNAVVLEKAAAMSRLEVQNLNNRQQVAVENAKAFLTMDVKNLDNKQQTAIFKAQEISDAIISDTAAANAAKATNATNKLDADKINETLALTASQYNAAERNKVKVANMNALNEMMKFNAQEQNDREEFNSRLSTEINVANAKILADISVANTAAINAASAVNAKNATDLTAATYAQQSQTYRDLLEMSWKTGEQEKDRVTNIAVASITKSAASSAAQITADATSNAAWGALAFKAVENWDKVKSVGSTVLSWF